MADALSSASHGSVPPAATVVAPKVHVAPAGTAGDAVADAEIPRQSFADALVHGTLRTSSSF